MRTSKLIYAAVLRIFSVKTSLAVLTLYKMNLFNVLRLDIP
jgi:hypothetical protein